MLSNDVLQAACGAMRKIFRCQSEGTTSAEPRLQAAWLGRGPIGRYAVHAAGCSSLFDIPVSHRAYLTPPNWCLAKDGEVLLWYIHEACAIFFFAIQA